MRLISAFLKSLAKISSGAIRVSLLFFLLSALWITLSDQALSSLTSDFELSSRLQTYKGWAYVLVASIVVFRLLQREIVWRQKAEAALERSEMESWELVQRVGDVIFSLAPDTVIRSLNPAFTTLTGWACADWLGKPFTEIVHPADLPLAKEKFAAVVRGETVLALELRLQGKERGPVLFELTLAPHLRDGIAAQLLGVGRDISERKRGDERLRQLSRAVEQSPTLVLITDTDGGIEYVNPKFSEITGYDLKEIKGRNPRILKSDRENPACYETLWTTIRQGGVWRGQFHNRKKSGECYWVSASISGVTNDAGVITHFVAVQEDITERKKAEEALRASQEFATNIIESSLDMILTTDLERRITRGNQAALTAFGYDEAELVGQKTALLYDDSTYSDVVHQSLMESGRYVGEVINRRKNGELFPSLLTASLLRDVQGQIVGHMGISRDITERKRAENKMREQAALLDITSDAILVRDLEQRVLFWNKGAERLYGWGAEEVLGRKATEFLWETQALPQIETIEPTVREAGQWWGEMHHVAKNGRKLIIEGRLTLMYDADATPRSVLMVCTDVTEKRHLQKQLLHVQRLESIGTLAGGIAHDLNNILAPILLSADILRVHITNPDGLRILSTVQEVTQRGADIVRQVLTFARGIDGERVPVDPRHLVGELIRMAAETFPKSILLLSRVSAEAWLVTGDGTQLHQILLNLCVNARDAMSGGGTLTVTAENAQLDKQYASMNPGAQPGPYVILKVSDTGTGIAPEIIDRIFDPFFTTKPKGKGTGLGLSTTLGIVKAHGGFLQVESQIGQGSTFRIFLPATPQAEARAGQRPPAAVPTGRGEWILVVDDESSIREMIQATLEQYGYRVITATDGVDGLAIYAQRQNEISVVLTDLMMPVMDGVAMIRALKKMNSKVKVIAASGLSSDYQRDDLERNAIEAFLTKPFVAEELLSVLSEVVVGRAPNPPPSQGEAHGGTSPSSATPS